VKRAFAAWAVLVYVGVLIAGMTGAGVALVLGVVVFALAYPEYFVTEDPAPKPSALDRLDGVGVRR
jgi:hypothetical protein